MHCLYFSRSCVISGFYCEVDENCAFLGYYTASSGNYLPVFWATYWSLLRRLKIQMILNPRRWDQQVVPKCWQEITTSCCIITQNSTFLFQKLHEIDIEGTNYSWITPYLSKSYNLFFILNFYKPTFLGLDGCFVHLLHTLTFCFAQNLVCSCSQFIFGAAIHGLIDIRLAFHLS